MVDSPHLRNYFRLLHNINFQFENPEHEKLLLLLSQSVIDLDELNILKNESVNVVSANLSANQPLLETLQNLYADGEKLYKVFRRETAFTSARIAGSSPTWANNAKLFKSIGPFNANDGRIFWFDFFEFTTNFITVLSGNDIAPVMLLSIKTIIFGRPTRFFKIEANTVWIRSNLIATGITKNFYTGFKIINGSLTTSEAHNVINKQLKLGVSENFSIQLELDNTYIKTGISNFGIDARDAEVELPASVDLQFVSNKIIVKTIAPGKWTVYGEDRNFIWDASQPTTYNAYLQRIVFPFLKDKPECEINILKSAFNNLAGRATVLSAGWCLPVISLDFTKPFDVKSNGALAILCTAGFSCKWAGLKLSAPNVLLGLPLIIAEPGKISITDVAPTFNALTEYFKLWKRSTDNDIRTTTELFFKNNKALNYYCDETGFESISTFADSKFEIDKPYRADGISVTPETKDSIYTKTIADSGIVVTLYDSDLILELNPTFRALKKPEIYQFAISNAYMLTTPPSSLLLAGNVDDNNQFIKAQLNIAYGLFNLTPTLPHPYAANINLDQFAVNAERLKEIREVSQWFPLLKNYLMSKCTWEEGVTVAQGTVKVDFELLTDLFKELNKLARGVEVDKQILNQLALEDVTQDFSLLQGGITNNDVWGKFMFSLLDVSTNYDLFGVNMVWSNRPSRILTNNRITAIGENIVTIEDMSLQAPMVLLNGYTLPHLSWEPFYNLTPPETFEYPPEGVLTFPDNGPPTVFSQLDLTKIKIDPLKYMQRFRENIKLNQNTPPFSYIIFALPHGKVSIANLHKFSDEIASVTNNYNFIQPGFTFLGNKLKGGLQFRITASNGVIGGRPKLPGQTNQLKNLNDRFGNSLNKSVLGVSVHDIFQNDFYKNSVTQQPETKIDGVPITHIDFSGYGASMFSNWKNPDAQIAQVSQAKFDVMVGRVSHEVVQVVSIVYPWGIKVVRTVTLYRNANAIIYREDSGWIAMSDGTFNFSFIAKEVGVTDKQPFDNPYTFHPGLIKGLFDINNIVEASEPNIEIDYTLQNTDYHFTPQKEVLRKAVTGTPAKAILKAVTFNANVLLDNAVTSEKSGYVSGKSFKGYLQISPQGVPIPPSILKELFLRQQNIIGGSIDCLIQLGGSQQLMMANRVDVSASYKDDNMGSIVFVAAAKGSVGLPAEGSWSVVEVDKKSGEVTPIANKLSVPVIRIGERNKKNAVFSVLLNDGISRIAFPDGLLNTAASFAKCYGYVQNTSTQKLLLSDPKYDKSSPTKLKTDPPLLADAYRLLNSKGPFVNLKNAIQIENGLQSVTEILSAGLAKTINDFKVPDKLSFDILGTDKDSLHMYVKYESTSASNSVINYATNSSPADVAEKWKNEVSNMSIVVDMGPFKELMTVSGNFKSKSSLFPGFESGNTPQLKLCKELQPIYDILEFLNNLDPTNPVEAVKKGLKIAMSNAADSWEYKFKAEKEIPLVKFPFDAINYNSPTTPLKLDAYFKIGCYFNEPVKIPNSAADLIPSAGAYLELGATLRIMCFSLGAATIYATGKAEVGLSADIKSGPNLYFKFGFGVELAVGLPVIGSVAVLYMVGVDMRLTTKDLTIGAFMYFRGRAEIFAGIVTITIQIEAAGKINKITNGPTNCIAMCTFALDISIFLIIDINFTETFEETRQIA